MTTCALPYLGYNFNNMPAIEKLRGLMIKEGKKIYAAEAGVLIFGALLVGNGARVLNESEAPATKVIIKEAGEIFGTDVFKRNNETVSDMANISLGLGLGLDALGLMGLAATVAARKSLRKEMQENLINGY